ncbi:MAG: hypothetical protein F6J87_21255 [Spirulina sp. SIO3F2]|nr:hypothetical protein [Spirulina sp. SIO3F2]
MAQQFEQEPWLPGVIIADEQWFWGMISRRRFNEWMSSPYGVEVLLERPIRIFLELSQQATPLLKLPATITVGQALEQALDRDVSEIYEPIVVMVQDETAPLQVTHFLLEFQTLVRVQAQIAQYTYQELHQHRKDLNRYVQRLGQSQAQLQRYAQQLQTETVQTETVTNRVSVSETEDIAASQELNDCQQSLQELQQMTQHLLDVSQQAVRSSQKAFQGTLGGMSVIIRNTQDIVEIGQLLDAELDKVQTTSHLIRNISQQIRQLAVQATIVANQADTKLTGFSSITNEIGQMISQTLEAGRDMDWIAERFNQKLRDLSGSAKEGMKAARSLIRKVQRAEAAVDELEAVTYQIAGEEQTNTTVSDLPDSGDTILPIANPQALAQKITHLEGTLTDLAALARQQTANHLVRKIQRTLAHHRATHAAPTKSSPTQPR